MASEEILTVRNSTNKELTLFWKGRRLSMAPFEEQGMVQELAQYFLDMHPNSCELADLDEVFGGGVSNTVKPTTVWVANVTGHPDAVEEFTIERWNKRDARNEKLAIRNPNFEPRTVVEVLHGAERIHRDSSGQEVSVYENSVPVSIPAYRLTELSAPIAAWLLGRSYSGVGEGITSVPVIKSRELPVFRPSTAWSIADIRTYLSMIENTNFTKEDKYGRSEAQIKTRTSVPTEFDRQVRAAKMILLKRCFFQQVDPAVRLPKESEFKEAQALALEGKKPKLAAEVAAVAAAERALE